VTNVQPTGGACVSGPTGGSVQSWDVQQGQGYQVTLSNVTDCAAGGTAASIQVIGKNSSTGNQWPTATETATGTYTFTVGLPGSGCNPDPIQYCTTGCSPATGQGARRNDGVCFQALLRGATFGAACAGPVREDNNCGCDVDSQCNDNNACTTDTCRKDA